MKKRLPQILLALLLGFGFVLPGDVYAVSCADVVNVTQAPDGEVLAANATNIVVRMEGVQRSATYTLTLGLTGDPVATANSNSLGGLEFRYNHFDDDDPGTVVPHVEGPGLDCTLPAYYVTGGAINCSPSSITLVQTRQDEAGNDVSCYARAGVSNSCMEVGKPITFYADGITEGGTLMNGQLELKLFFGLTNFDTFIANIAHGETQHWVYNNTPTSSTNFQAIVQDPGDGWNYCEASFNLSPDCQQTCLDYNDLPDPPETGERAPFTLCSQLPEGSDAFNQCISCAEGEGGQEGVWTAIGCIKKDPESILTVLLRTGLTIGGGIALLMILSAGFIFSTSAGDPKRVDQAKELMTNSVVGLIFIIFSIVMLQFIGFTVLKIPGFGG